VTPDGDLIVPIRPPDARPPGTVDLFTPTKGQRVVLINPERATYRFDVRATSDPFVDPRGILRVCITDESEWYAQQITGREPKIIEARATRVFVERPDV
jgi:hypothetical protein